MHIFTIPQCKDSSLSSKYLCVMEAETLGVSYEQYCDPYGLETIY
ncbi:hypothetical protein [Acinetobacter bereziniae]|jgi:hypothetical protein|nr:hypothetical protein [Acinetobacter bereziniae]